MSINQKKRKRLAHKRAFLWVALWICVIWGNSFMNGSVSSSESGLVVRLVRPIAEWFALSDINQLTFIVRKVAHFSEYFILGLLTFHALYANRIGDIHWIVAALVLVSCVPVVDEQVIQAMTPGRMAAWSDVGIDLSGMWIALAVMNIRGRIKMSDTIGNSDIGH